MDSNGYAPSLFDTVEDECYICGRGCRCARHEILYGSNRELSKRYGLWIYVCPDCHQNGPEAIHKEPKKYDWLKREAQEHFERENPTKDFITIFGRNYR